MGTIYWTQLKEPLGFKSDNPPDETTISRALAKLPLEHLGKDYLLSIKNNQPDIDEFGNANIQEH